MNKKILAAVVSTFAFGTASLAVANEPAKAEAPAKAEKGKKADKAKDAAGDKGGAKSCNGDKGGAKGCGGEHKAGDKSCGAKK